MNFNFNGSREIEHVRDMHMDFASRSMKLDLNILHKIEMNILEYLWTFFMFFLDIKHYYLNGIRTIKLKEHRCVYDILSDIYEEVNL